MDKKTIVIMILEAILFIGIIVAISHINNKKVDVLDQNLQASKDRVSELIMENGSLLADKKAYVVKEKELYDIIDIQKQEKKNIEKLLDEKISYIAEIESHVQIDTIEIVKENIIYKSDLETKFDYNGKWITFNGKTFYNNGTLTTSIYNINIPTPLKVGLTDDYTIFVESKNPYINITHIDGAVIDGSNLYKNKPRFNFGIQAGIGINYGMFGRQVDIGPYVGLGINYNF